MAVFDTGRSNLCCDDIMLMSGIQAKEQIWLSLCCKRQKRDGIGREVGLLGQVLALVEENTRMLCKIHTWRLSRE